MTGAEQLRQQGREQGREQGIKQGERNALTMLLRTRFDKVPPDVLERIEKAEQTDIEHWLKRFATSDSLAQIFS